MPAFLKAAFVARNAYKPSRHSTARADGRVGHRRGRSGFFSQEASSAAVVVLGVFSATRFIAPATAPSSARPLAQGLARCGLDYMVHRSLLVPVVPNFTLPNYAVKRVAVPDSDYEGKKEA